MGLVTPKDIELSDRLDIHMRERMLELLKHPYAGTKGCFRIEDSDARYNSNCFGTAVYVFGLKDDCLESTDHPVFVGGSDMERLINEHFTPADALAEGCLVVYYGEDYMCNQALMHAAILVSGKSRIFHQSGSGGIFALANHEEKYRALSFGFPPIFVYVACYRLKDGEGVIKCQVD